jgi:hypothetical protein
MSFRFFSTQRKKESGPKGRGHSIGRGGVSVVPGGGGGGGGGGP